MLRKMLTPVASRVYHQGMEIDNVETTARFTTVNVIADPADCCQERTTSGGCDCKVDNSEETAIDLAMEHLGTTETPTTVDPTTYGWAVTFETAYLKD